MKLRISILVLFLLLAAYTFKSFTPPILASNSIADLTGVSINGDRQYLLLRGRDRSAPVLLFVHGGPGMPAMYLAHDFQRQLERHFVVVHWDQRGAGKSYKKAQDVGSLRISTLLEDMDLVVDALRQRLGQERLWIVGHSHGSYLGALYAGRHPEKVRAFVGVGQVANARDSRTLQLQEAFLRPKLAELGFAPDLPIHAGNVETLLFEAGAEIHGATSFTPLLTSGLVATEYSLFDALNIARGSQLSSRHMVYDLPTDLVADQPAIGVPVAIVMGEHDYVTPHALAREYFDQLQAPDKEWFVVADTAHFPHFENPAEFTRLLLDLKVRWQQDPEIPAG